MINPSSNIVIPNYIASKSLTGLRRKMLKLYNKDKLPYKFHIYFDSEKKQHVAWFYQDMDSALDVLSQPED